MRKSLAAMMTLTLVLSTIVPVARPGLASTVSARAPLPPTPEAARPPIAERDAALDRAQITPPSPDHAPPEIEQARAREAIEGVLAKYLEYWGPRYQLGPVDVAVEGEKDDAELAARKRRQRAVKAPATARSGSAQGGALPAIAVAAGLPGVTPGMTLPPLQESPVYGAAPAAPAAQGPVAPMPPAPRNRALNAAQGPGHGNGMAEAPVFEIIDIDRVSAFPFLPVSVSPGRIHSNPACHIITRVAGRANQWMSRACIGQVGGSVQRHMAILVVVGL